jgi:alanine racemase
MSRSVLLIDKEALFHNIRSLYQFSGKPIIAVVKSDAYGVGVKYIASLGVFKGGGIFGGCLCGGGH